MGAASSLLGASNTLYIQARNPASNAQRVDEIDDSSKEQLPARSSVDGHLGARPRAELPHPGLTSDPDSIVGNFLMTSSGAENAPMTTRHFAEKSAFQSFSSSQRAIFSRMVRARATSAASGGWPRFADSTRRPSLSRAGPGSRSWPRFADSTRPLSLSRAGPGSRGWPRFADSTRRPSLSRAV